MKKLLLVLLTGVACSATYAQTFVNRGAPVAVTNGGLMIVRSDNATIGSGSLENDATYNGSTAGIFKNAGKVVVEGSFVNTSGVADGSGTNTGQYFVKRDWVNNATFTADQSLVNLYGDAQSITSSNNTVTTFYNLTDSNSGTPGVKTQTLDANVSNVLAISDAEHATSSYFLNVTNADPGAIFIDPNDVNNSFVSSTAGGRLVRNTNQKAEYIFPTGISARGAAKIREASITPANTQARYYKVRYAENAPSTSTTSDDGYDTIKKSGGILEVNDVFYHIVVASDNTSPADLGIHSDVLADGPWTSIGSWRGSPSQWENLQDVVATGGQPGAGRVKFVKAAWTPAATDTVYALIDTVPIKKDFNFPTAFVGDGQNLTHPENGYFTIINVADIVTLDELSVFNRWGEMVFNNKREGTDKWDGKFNGKLQTQGNYVFLAKVRNKQTNKLYPTVTGNVSLIW